MKTTKVRFITITLITVFAISIFYLNSCDEGPTEPKIEPGRRDYVWEIDTLKMPFFSSLDKIWGSSENDVWAIGPGGDLSNTIYHFDGGKWDTDGISRGISPISICGFGHNDVWIGGLEGRIWHYNGVEWKERLRLPHPQFLYSGFMDIYGDKSSDIYAVGFVDSTDGRKGIIFHYDGIEWKRINIQHTKTTLTRIKRGLKTSNNYFIRGIFEDDWQMDTTKIFMFDGEKLTELYSAPDIQDKTNFIQNIDGEMIFVIGYSLNRFSKNQFLKYYNVNELNFGVQIFGRTMKDVFFRMEDGIAHYDGNNLEYLVNDNDVNVREGILFEKKGFFLANDFNNGLNLVYKGTLKK
ncbi:MAG: hypothetical protein IPH62_06835 [Ignavibacteriae bacterium]|nr:hypothetical protein [Ignavibacteriota bacterium]